MSCYVDKVIRIARAEKGYLEKASKSNLDSKTANAGSNNYTKYARDLDAINFYNGRKNGHAWCDCFVDWCFVQAYGKAKALELTCQPTKAANNCGAGCKYSMQYYQKKKRFHTTPKIGDQMFFKESSGSGIAHTALVYKVDAKYVYTVEGNTSSSSGVVANGGCVAEKKYKLDYKRIAGYGRPAYDVEKVVTSEEYQCIHVVVKGNSLWSIATKYLGKGTRYPEIMELNDLPNINIKVGQKLKIPKK